MVQEKNGRMMRSVWAALALSLLAGCAARGGHSVGTVATLPPPSSMIQAFGGAEHLAALTDPALMKAQALDDSDEFEAAAAAYRAAAEAGNPIARYLLAEMYNDGDGVTRDDGEAARQFHIAAFAGYALAQTRLGDAYEKGIGVNRDQAMANRWYFFSAAQGEDVASSRLAMSMLKGEGMPRDVEGALKILHHCAAPEARAGTYYPNGVLGGAGCKALLGVIYVEGDYGIPKDIEQGMKFLTQSANQHLPVAEKHLADIYEQGKIVPADPGRAQHWREQAQADSENQPGFEMKL